MHPLHLSNWWLPSFATALVNSSMSTWMISLYFHVLLKNMKSTLKLYSNSLRDHHLFLSKSKVDLYSKRLECLSHIMDDWGIHTDADKMQCIHEWRCPRTFNNVQHFLGLVQYLAHYMPDISTYTTPLLGCVKNSHPFEWMPLLDKCFESFKTLTCKAPILKPIDHNNPDSIWVITDGSKAGEGAI